MTNENLNEKPKLLLYHYCLNLRHRHILSSGIFLFKKKKIHILFLAEGVDYPFLFFWSLANVYRLFRNQEPSGRCVLTVKIAQELGHGEVQKDSQRSATSGMQQN